MANLNRYMHSRNPYKNPPNFKDLAIKYPDFRKHATQELTGKVRINFRDADALRALTVSLLHRDFGLQVEFPPGHLIPTLPLRLNYILWIEDLLSVLPYTGQPTRGIDIGTGAACIYPHLAAKKNGWAMLATETDSDNTQWAAKNVRENGLDGLINIKQVSADSILAGNVEADGQFAFCMCNPPFFGNPRDAETTRERNPEGRPPPRNARSGTPSEVAVEGGEVAFVQRMIAESHHLSDQVAIFTTMVGHKSSLPELKHSIQEAGAAMTEAHFCQGHTMRWGLAWTFQAIPLHEAPALRKPKDKPPLIYVVPKWSVKKYTVPIVMKQLRRFVNELSVECETIKCNKHTAVFRFVAWENTWSNRRKKRREATRLANKSEVSDAMEMSPSTSHGTKRHRSDSESDSDSEKAKKLRTDVEVDSGVCASELSFGSEEMEKECVLKCNAVIRRSSGNVVLDLHWLDGTEGRDAMHQVMQYLKNRLADSRPPAPSEEKASSEEQASTSMEVATE